MFPTKNNCTIDWRTVSWRRNGILGRLSYAKNSCDMAINSSFISAEDKVNLLLIRDQLSLILGRWDRHFVKNLRKEVESKQKERDNHANNSNNTAKNT